MWERFSYYGMRALLVLYMVNYFKWAQKDASSVYKWYTSLVYLTPLLGGFLADRYLGNKRAVIIGALLMAVGHFLMAFEHLTIFYAALIFLIFGNGFFKPNMSTQVGRLYPTNDPRRDGAYTIFYMGINLGAFMSPLLCGWLAANTVGGYHTGFTMAGIGMVFGLLVYLVGLPFVKELKTEEANATLHNAGDERLFAVLTDAVRRLQEDRWRDAPGGQKIEHTVKVEGVPANFDTGVTGLRPEEFYDPTTGLLIATVPLTDEHLQRSATTGPRRPARWPSRTLPRPFRKRSQRKSHRRSRSLIAWPRCYWRLRCCWC